MPPGSIHLDSMYRFGHHTSDASDATDALNEDHLVPVTHGLQPRGKNAPRTR